MPARRPGAVTAIAVLHLIGGGLGLLLLACSGIQLAAGGGQPFAGGGAQAAEQKKLQEQTEKALEDLIPHHKAFSYAEMGIQAVLGIMLLTAGIGLLNMRPWARTLSIVYAVLSILNRIASGVIAIMTVGVMNDVISELAQNDPNVARMKGVFVGIYVAMMVVSFLFIIYPIVVLIVMLRPKIAAAFRGERREGEFDEDEADRGWGDDDEGWRGRREPDDRSRE